MQYRRDSTRNMHTFHRTTETILQRTKTLPLLNTQLICDNQGHIRYLQAGFLGSTHDSLTFRFIEPIGPGLALDFPANAFLLADRGYPDVQPLLTPFRQAQIRRLGQRDRR